MPRSLRRRSTEAAEEGKAKGAILKKVKAWPDSQSAHAGRHLSDALALSISKARCVQWRLEATLMVVRRHGSQMVG